MTAARLLQLARTNGVMVATAESCTAGLIAGEITSVAGSSAIFDRGFVTYTNAAKIAMLGVDPATLDAHGAVSEEVAHQMADGALIRSDAALAVAVTGIAGPGGGSAAKPEGRVCFALAGLGRTASQTVDFGPLGRSQVRAVTVDHAIALLIHRLRD